MIKIITLFAVVLSWIAGMFAPAQTGVLANREYRRAHPLEVSQPTPNALQRLYIRVCVGVESFLADIGLADARVTHRANLFTLAARWGIYIPNRTWGRQGYTPQLLQRQLANFDPGDVHIQQAMRDFSVKYKNEETIWPEVAPVVQVDKRSDRYWVFGTSMDYDQTPDQVAPNADANEIHIELSNDNYSVRDYALMMPVDKTAVDNADDAVRPLVDIGLAAVRKQLDNRQEVRVANVVFNNASYAASNRVTLSGTGQWSDYTNADPIQALLTYLDIPLQRPNTIVLGANTWRVMRSHPRVVAAVFPNGGNSANRGMVSASALLELLRDEGIEKIVIGRARVNTAKPNAPISLTRAWGNHAALIYVKPGATKEDPSFVKTFASSISNPQTFLDQKKGVSGSYFVKDGWSVDIKVTAQLGGYYIENAVA